MITAQKPRGILKLKKKNTDSVQARSKAMSSGILSNTGLLGSLTAQGNALVTQSAALDTAEAPAKKKIPGAASLRNVQRDALIALMVSTLVQIQALADAAPTYDQAVAILQTAGVVIAITPHRSKAILAATQALPGGNVILNANATALGAAGKKKSCFNWAMTLDGGKTWIALPSTPKCKTSVPGLTALTTYGFRVSVTDSSGAAGAWSQTINLLVH